MAFLFFGYTQAFEGNKMGGRVFNDLFLIFWWTLPQSFAIRACAGMSKETLAIATAAMEENEVLACFLFRPERKHSLVIYLAHLLLACSWAKRRYGVYP
jgi:hypothetical protein